MQVALSFESCEYFMFSAPNLENKPCMTYDVMRQVETFPSYIWSGGRSLTTVVSMYAPAVCSVRAFYHGLSSYNKKRRKTQLEDGWDNRKTEIRSTKVSWKRLWKSCNETLPQHKSGLTQFSSINIDCQPSHQPVLTDLHREKWKIYSSWQIIWIILFKWGTWQVMQEKLAASFYFDFIERYFKSTIESSFYEWGLVSIVTPPPPVCLDTTRKSDSASKKLGI